MGRIHLWFRVALPAPLRSLPVHARPQISAMGVSHHERLGPILRGHAGRGAETPLVGGGPGKHAGKSFSHGGRQGSRHRPGSDRAIAIVTLPVRRLHRIRENTWHGPGISEGIDRQAGAAFAHHDWFGWPDYGMAGRVCRAGAASSTRVASLGLVSWERNLARGDAGTGTGGAQVTG